MLGTDVLDALAAKVPIASADSVYFIGGQYYFLSAVLKERGVKVASFDGTPAEAVNAAGSLGGAPVLAPRVSSADERERHRGLSHHTLAVLELVPGRARVAWPAGLDAPSELGPVEVVDASSWRADCVGLDLSHMGRGPDEEPWFFAAAFAAGRLARALVP